MSNVDSSRSGGSHTSTASSSSSCATTVHPPSPGAGGSEGEGVRVGGYRLDKIIGQGTYGKVRLGIHTVTHEKVAVKIIEKAQIRSPKQISRLQREIRFLKLLHHPHIVRIYDVIETADFIYIVMEYAVGGELFDYIVANKRVKEKEARSFFRMVLSAVDYCHKNAVIHRDLKPENLLFDDRKCIKIIDFGFGNNFSVDSLLDTFCGSPFYAAPEMILGKKYEGPEVDMWSLGIIMYALLCGHLPFDDDNMKELYKKIASGAYTCPDYMLPNARHLIARLITVDPKKRATLPEVMNHPWVNEGYSGPPPNYLPVRPTITNPDALSADIIQRLKIVGYSYPDIIKAFTDGENQSRPNPIRATYWLLSEMITREEAKLRRQQQLSAPVPGHKYPIGAAKSMPDGLCGAEGEEAPLPGAGPPVGHPPTPLPTPAELDRLRADFHRNLKLAAFQQKEFVSLQQLSTLPTAPSAEERLTVEQRSSPLHLHQSYALPKSPPPSLPPHYTTSSGRGAQPSSSSSSSSSHQHQPPQYQHTRPISPLPLPVPVDTVRRDSGISSGSLSPLKGSQPTLLQPSPQHHHRDTKGVGGWLLNVSTTSSRTPQEITLEVTRVLRENDVKFHFDASNVLVCSAHVSMLEEHGSGASSSSSSSSSNSSTSGNAGFGAARAGPSPVPGSTSMSAWMSGSGGGSGTIDFLIELCKIPRMTMYGVHFKRVSGGVWNYKKVCAKLLSQMTGL